MKMFGSTYADTMIGTGTEDTIQANDGNDLIDGGGGQDTIIAGGGADLISGFSISLANLRASPSRGCDINGGGGSDTLIVDITPSAKISMLQSTSNVMKIGGIEEIIYSVGSTTPKQQIVGTENKLETICASGNANVRGMGGTDYIYSQDGDDTLSGGNGNDYLSAGTGHNTVTGGAGADYFAFRFDGIYQYTNVTDFNAGQDKIAIILTVQQVSTYLGVSGAGELQPKRSYGDGVQGVGGAINDYVSYDHGRLFDRSDFYHTSDKFDDFVTYERSTGSVLLTYFERDEQNKLDAHHVLIAHLEGNPNLHADDFMYLIM